MDEVAFLQELVSIPSTSGNEAAVAACLLEHMGELGFCVSQDAVGNAIGTLGEAGAARQVVLLGHMDTVAGEVPVRQVEGKLYGRGAVDAKGPLACFVLAAARAGRQTGVRWTVIGAVGEEDHSPGAHYLAETMPAPDAVFIGEPSGWEGIILGYKGTLCADYRLEGPRRHGASGQATPAEQAVGFWNRLRNHANHASGGRAWRFDTLDPSLRSVNTQEDGLRQGVEMAFNLRTPPGLDVEALKQEMLSWCDGAQLSFPYQEPPFRADKNTAPVRALLRAIRQQGGQPRFKLKMGTSDMNVVGPAWGCPIVAYGPGDSTLDHTPDEHIELAEFRRAVDVLAGALLLLTG